MQTTALGVALVACGDMGMHLAQQAATIDGVSIVAGCDTVEAGRQRFEKAFGIAADSDIDELLARPGIDMVIVASPPALHRQMVEKVAVARKHVFCEKPFAITLADCDAMIAACRATGVQLMVGQVLRFIQPFAAIYEHVVNQRLAGEIFGMEMRRYGGGFAGQALRPWRKQIAQTGGMLMELNAHEFDFMRYICGDAVSVHAFGGNFQQRDCDYEDFSIVSIEFAAGTIGVLHASMASAINVTDGALHGTKGTLTYRWGGGTQLMFHPFEGEAQELDVTVTEEPYRQELRLFVDSIRRGDPSPIPGSEGRAAVELALAAYESSYNRLDVTLPMPPNSAPKPAMPRTAQHRLSAG